MNVDFGRASGDYATHRAGFPDVFFDRLFAGGLVSSGQNILDLGTGTGTLARGFAKRGCQVTALDPSAPLLKEARRLSSEEGLNVAFLQGVAEATEQDDASFDIVTAGQCWHWFDRTVSGREAFRLLRDGGRLLIAHFDWLPLPGSLVEATEHLILRHNPAWALAGSTGIYPQWFADLSMAGFQNIESFSFDVEIGYTKAAWMGRIRASAGVGAVLQEEAITAFDSDHGKVISAYYPGERFVVPHRVFVVSGVRAASE